MDVVNVAHQQYLYSDQSIISLGNPAMTLVHSQEVTIYYLYTNSRNTVQISPISCPRFINTSMIIVEVESQLHILISYYKNIIFIIIVILPI